MDNMNNQPECEIDEHGNKYWYLNEYLHREDGPAIETPYGLKEWWLHGKRHSKDGPAVVYADGRKEWYLEDEEVEPEDVVDYNLAKGIFCYYEEAYEELIFEPDFVIDEDENEWWYLNGEHHREDGPAVERADGDKEWWLNGEEVEPETLVDLWLSRGIFCYYDEKADELIFGGNNE